MKFYSIIVVLVLAVFIAGGMDKTCEAAEKGKASSIAKAKDVYTVEELFAKKDELKGKRISVRGKVTKFSEGIAGRNWIHLQDGSGKPGTNDITITTSQGARVGDVVLITGNFVADKDFGAGYKYAVFIEDAAVTLVQDKLGENLGITKKAYIKTYNQQLSRLLGLRFEKFGSSTKVEDAYKLPNDTAYLSLKPGDSEQLSEVVIIVMNVEGRPEKEFIAIMNLGVAIAVESNPTTNTINLFTKKFQDKVDQGLNEFSFEMGNKSISVKIKKPGAVFVTIKPL